MANKNLLEVFYKEPKQRISVTPSLTNWFLHVLAYTERYMVFIRREPHTLELKVTRDVNGNLELYLTDRVKELYPPTKKFTQEEELAFRTWLLDYNREHFDE